jgi:hypothetical protein
MKSGKILSIFAGCFVIVGAAGSAWAGATVHASICQPETTAAVDGLIWHDRGVTNLGSTTLQLICPAPVDHNVGSSLQWQTVVADSNNSDAVECYGVAMDAAGSLLGTTAPASSGNLFTGTTALQYSFTVGTGSDTYSYASRCYLPRVTGLHSTRVF